MINKEQDLKERTDAIGRTHTMDHLRNEKNCKKSWINDKFLKISGIIYVETNDRLILVKTAIKPNKPIYPSPAEACDLRARAKRKKACVSQVTITHVGSTAKVVLSELPSESGSGVQPRPRVRSKP